MSVRILQGDCRAVLPTLAADSIHCCVTSPPYFGLRNYGADGQIGLEETPDAYVAEMVAVFREVRRVLRPDGTLWLNLGDSYAGGGCGARDEARWPKQSRNDHMARHAKRNAGCKPKDLIGIPWMVAFALRADGWFLRKDIIWHKPNPMPESVFDRPTSAHEHVFLLTKSGRYAYDGGAIAEGAVGRNAHDLTGGRYAPVGQPAHTGTRQAPVDGLDGTRNARDVWTIATQPFAGAHFATMPPELAARCIRAGAPEGGCCEHCGTPFKRVIERGEANLDRQRACGGDASGGYAGQSTKGHAAAGVQDASDVKRRILAGMVEKRTTGWRPLCACVGAARRRCTVLDPFGGAGTTALVADRLGRDAVHVELNPSYAAMARERLAGDAGMFFAGAAE
ncbi:DNA-methyltransferase [Rhizosaccharibacter radicis]|uniref:Methyltransferase n=1 Tax=Rhizosaccharibacter radicis TaxID=2782605 RepID=A0ABT1VW36_9PROT|nr:site-specific DNA-methyltransferase [Acetobacteraceae bacterium KSS12]